MAFGFKLGAAPSDVEAVQVVIPSAINLFSWEDMCTERGGITLLILLSGLIFYLGVRYHILIAGANESLKIVTSPLYDQNRRNLTPFRRLMAAIESLCVLPFVPAELDSFVMWIFMWYVAITIPMGITRYYESRWSHDLITLQGPLNLISYYVFGCESLDLEAIP